jgi:hypothetical protein
MTIIRSQSVIDEGKVDVNCFRINEMGCIISSLGFEHRLLFKLINLVLKPDPMQDSSLIVFLKWMCYDQTH